MLKVIGGAIDAIQKLIGHSPHPAIVAVPIGAWTSSNVCDALAIATGDDRFDDAARWTMGIGLVGAAGAVVTGLRDYSYIPTDRPSHDTATAHGLGNAVVSSLFVASYIMRVRAAAEGRSPSTLARTLALTAGGLSLYTAWLGGKLVQEYGESVKPVMESLPEHEEHGRERLDPASPLGRNAQ